MKQQFTTHNVPLFDLLNKITIVLRCGNFTGFYLIHNTVNGSYSFGSADRNSGVQADPTLRETGWLSQGTSTQIEMLQDLFPGNTAYYRELLGKKVITREAYIKLVQ